MGNYDLTGWLWVLGASRVTCTLDDCSCKRTSCALRLGLHWAVRSCGGCSAVSLPAHLHHPWDRSHRRLLLEKPNHHSSSNYCWWATSFYPNRRQSHTAPFRARDRKREKGRRGKLAVEKREKEREEECGDKRVVRSCWNLPCWTLPRRMLNLDPRVHY